MEPYIGLQRARQAAAQLFDDISSVAFVSQEDNGTRHYKITRKGGESVTVTLNPNGRKAAVEWKRDSKNGSGYRVFHLQGVIAEPSEAPTPMA